MWDQVAPALGALIPSLCVLAVFVVVVRAMVLGDRREREHRQAEEAELRERLASRREP